MFSTKEDSFIVVNATILGCHEPVTTAMPTYIRAWGEWLVAQIKDKTREQCGEMDMLSISDRVSKHVKDAIRSFVIKDWQWIDNNVKEYDSRNLNCWSGAPPEACLIVI